MQDQGQAGDNLGALCRGLKREDIRKGQVRTAICALAVLFCLCVFCVCVCVLCVCVCGVCVCVYVCVCVCSVWVWESQLHSWSSTRPRALRRGETKKEEATSSNSFFPITPPLPK